MSVLPLFLLSALLGALFGGLTAALTAMLLGLVVPTVFDLVGVLTARAVGIRVFSLFVGGGDVVADREGERLRLLVRSWPIGVGWSGDALGPRLVRTKFFLAHLVPQLALAVTAALSLTVWDVPALAAATLATLVLNLLPSSDAFGRGSAGRQLRAIPRLSDDEIADWHSSRLGQQAHRAVRRRDNTAAVELAHQALAADPGDRSALLALASACDRLGDTQTALSAAERLTKGGDAAARLVSQGNLAWYLARAHEAGHAPSQWRERALAALDYAEQVGQRWELQHTRALVHALSGQVSQAEDLLTWPESEAVLGEERADVALTRAYLAAERGEPAEAGALVAEARRLCPDLVRADQVAARLHLHG